MSSPSFAKIDTLDLAASFGTWPLDILMQDAERRKTKTISLSTKSALTLFDDKYVAKFWRTDDLPREFDITTRAGDCAVSLIGRVFHEGKLLGIVMPYETTLDPTMLATKEERICIINQLGDLVRRLHKKNIIHGDIKPSNILRCSDGQLRFCDFGCASVEGDGFVPDEYTTHYSSPWRVRNSEKPLSKAEDLYATGVSLWEIYTGTPPFPEAEDEGDVEDFVRAGIRPDIACIDDLVMANLISVYLDSGPPLSDTIFHTGTVCVETEYSLQFCSNDPPHTYTRVLQCWDCIREKNAGPCPRRFVQLV